MTTRHSPVKKREIFGWAMFDFANSSYTTVVVTVAFSVYFTQLVAPAARADFLWSVGVTVSNALVVVLAPLVGAVADDSGRKKQFLFASYLVCVAGTASLWFVLPGMVGLGLLLFIVSNIAFSFGENFAGAFLPEISTPQNIGRISGFGWGLGYFGGLACLLAIFPFLRGDFVAENLHQLRLSWLVTAAFFLVAGIPTFLLLRERAPRGPRRSLAGHARVGYERVAATVRALRHFSQLARFLAVFFVFTCGLAAVIYFSAIYAKRTLGFGAAELIVLFLVVQVSSAAGALGFGWLQDRLGAILTIRITLVLWIGVCVGRLLHRQQDDVLRRLAGRRAGHRLAAVGEPRHGRPLLAAREERRVLRLLGPRRQGGLRLRAAGLRRPLVAHRLAARRHPVDRRLLRRRAPRPRPGRREGRPCRGGRLGRGAAAGGRRAGAGGGRCRPGLRRRARRGSPLRRRRRRSAGWWRWCGRCSPASSAASRWRGSSGCRPAGR